MSRPRRAAGDQDGFTLIELMVGMTLSMVLLALVLGSFEQFSTRTERNNKLTSAEDGARSHVDEMVASLRNASGALGSNNSPVVAAGDYDIAVNTDRPGFGITPGTAGTARYCVNSTNQLWFSWIPTPNSNPGAAACPAPGWTAHNVLKSGVANRTVAQPLFQYSSATPSSVRSAQLNLALTTNGSDTTKLQAGVFFRSLAQTAPAPPAGSVNDPTCDPSNHGSTLVVSNGLGTDSDGNPNRIVIYDIDGSGNTQQVGTGVGTKNLTLTAGVHTIRTRVYNVLGRWTDIDRTVSCS